MGPTVRAPWVQGRHRPTRRVRLSLEALEPRRLLAAEVIISEFLARNDAGLRDGNGRSSDWIEVYNAGDEVAHLEGYRLTNDPLDQDKWRFPATDLDPGRYLIVFASGRDERDYVDPEGNPHTNFTLRRGGDYVGLISPEGQVVSEYGSGGSNFPEQLANVSYGLAQKETLIDAGSDAYYWVPLDGNLDATWTARQFDASANGFQRGKAAIGFESEPDDRVNFASEIRTTVRERSHAVYVRIPFDVADASAVRELHLHLKYDNGFIAYLNGVEVARDNAPANPSWFLTAPENGQRDADVLAGAPFDLGDHLDALADGTNVLSIHVLNHLPDDQDMLLVPELVAVIPETSGPIGFMPEPTPGRANDVVFDGLVADTRFSVDRGFYDTPQTVVISTATEDAFVYYTTNGTAPTPSNSDASIVTGPLTIAETTTLRAAAYRTGYLPTNVDTQTYLFPEDVSLQPRMITAVTEDPVWGSQMRDSLLAIPTLSIVSGDASLVREDRPVTQEIPASVELIFPDGTAGFQIDAGLEHYGGHTLNNSPKKNIRLSFKSRYGAPTLQYDLFGEGATDQFDQILLRTGSHDNWFWTHQTGNRGIYVRNKWANDRQLEMGQPAPHGRYVHVYLDGTYWGMHQLMERPDDAFMESYFGGDKADYDVLNGGTPINGDAVAWNELRRSTGDYDQLLRYLDPVNYADYMLLQFYGGNDWDWNTSQNWMAARKREEGAGWKFFSWDSDLMLRTWLDARGSERANVVNRGGPGNLWGGISQHAEFRMLLADRAQKYFFHDGILTTDRVASQLQALANQIRLPLIAETARWDRTYTVDTWQENFDRVVNSLVPDRDKIVIGQLRRAGVFPDIDAPGVLVNGVPQFKGPVDRDSQVALSAAVGTIYYTLDGSDPRMPGGAVSPSALEFTAPFSITGPDVIKARALRDDEWSALTETSFQIQSDFGMRITELNYRPHRANLVPGAVEVDTDHNAFEFVELTNVTDAVLDLEGVRLTQETIDGKTEGVEFTFTSQALSPGERMVVVRDRAAFQSRYGADVRVAAGRANDAGTEGEFGGELSDEGEQLTLVDSQGRLIQQFRYDADAPWPVRAAGRGSSLEIVDVDGNDNSPWNWRSSVDFGGSPGREGRYVSGPVVINEVLPTAPTPEADVIELYNAAPQAVDISGWYVSNTDEDYFRFQVPPSVSIPGGGFHILEQAEFGFELDGARGDGVWLVAADASGRPVAFADQVQFEPTASGVSVGRSPNGRGPLVAMSETTFGATNANRRIGDVIISEVHFNPRDPDGERRLQADDFEFIELYNRTEQSRDLSNWRIAGNVQFTVAAGTTIAPHETLVVVPFSPADEAKSNVFRFYLNTNASLPLYGPYQDQLDDSRNLVRLEQPEPPPLDAPGLTPYVLVDAVSFHGQPPWPTFVGTDHHSLTRVQADVDGAVPIAWAARVASPGTAAFRPRIAGDANDDGAFDQRDVALVLESGKYLTGAPATWNEGDFDGDGVFDERDVVRALQDASFEPGPDNALLSKRPDETTALDALFAAGLLP